jgi:hypothetical protein
MSDFQSRLKTLVNSGDGTFDSELLQFSKDLKLSNVQIISRDVLTPAMFKKYTNFVINLQSSQDGGGTHWCGMFKIPQQKFVVYMDSYSGPPPQDIVDIIDSFHYDIAYNSKDIQEFNTSLCGLYSLLFLCYMNHIPVNPGEDKLDILQVFQDSFYDSKRTRNDKICYEMLSMFYKNVG